MTHLELEKDYLQQFTCVWEHKDPSRPGFGTMQCSFRAMQFNSLMPAHHFVRLFDQILSRKHLIGHWAAIGLAGLGSGIQGLVSHIEERIACGLYSCCFQKLSWDQGLDSMTSAAVVNRDTRYDTDPSLKEFTVLLGLNIPRRDKKGIIQGCIMKGKTQGPKYVF